MMSKHECCNENENGRCHYSAWKCIGWGILGVVGFVVIAVLIGLTIMTLWNWLLPGLFNWPVITFYQALGLAILSRLLFGGCGKGFHRMHRKYHGHRYYKHGCSCNCGCDSDKECCSDKTNDVHNIEKSAAPDA
jgi:hypothetical protein